MRSSMKRCMMLVALTLVAAVPAVAAAPPPGPYMGCTSRAGAESSHALKRRPSTCGWWPASGLGYNTGNFRSIHWRSWGSQSARATAVAYGQQTGTKYANKVQLGLSRPVTCYGMYRLFTRMTVTSKFGKGRLAAMRCSDIEDQE
jgi:hypothetical protein